MLFKVLLLFCCVLMILLVLMQRPKQEGLGAAFGGGMTDSLLGAGTTNFLQKATVYLAVAFFILSAGLAIMVAKKQRGEDAIPLPAALDTELTVPGGVTPAVPGDAPALPTQLPAEVPVPATTPESAPVETTDPAPAETTPEPAATEPVPAETAPEPAATEPVPAEPVPAEPTPAEGEPAPADGDEPNN